MKEANHLSGGRLAGGNPIRGRVDNDFYATPPEATEALFNKEKFDGTIWEPACGNGMMAKVIMKYNYVIASDLIDRGYGSVGIDFLASIQPAENIITNPPFSLFQEFAEHSLEIPSIKKVALFGKLQALEGRKRADFLEKSPLKTVYVFKKRINPLRNGESKDENGKAWASTMAFAWYVWDKEYNGETFIQWI